VLLVYFLNCGDTVTALCYCGALAAVIASQSSQKAKVAVPRHDNANQTCDSLWHYSWEVMNHPPYGPDLTPSDFRLCELLKKHLAGKKMATDTNIKQNDIS